MKKHITIGSVIGVIVLIALLFIGFNSQSKFFNMRNNNNEVAPDAIADRDNELPIPPIFTEAEMELIPQNGEVQFFEGKATKQGDIMVIY